LAVGIEVEVVGDGLVDYGRVDLDGDGGPAGYNVYGFALG
jgi:hypothetical protein